MGRFRMLIAIAVGAAALILAMVVPAAASPPSLSVVSASVNVTGSGLNWNTTAVCPAGKQVTGGGFQLNQGGITNYLVDASAPNSQDTQWSVALDYYGSTPFTLTAYAVCFG